jgi:gamma-glutamyl phosphate reductase
MSSAAESKNPQPIAAQVQAARRAARELARLSADQRNQILLTAADLLEARKADILKANQQDCEALEQ